MSDPPEARQTKQGNRNYGCFTAPLPGFIADYSRQALSGVRLKGIGSQAVTLMTAHTDPLTTCNTGGPVIRSRNSCINSWASVLAGDKLDHFQRLFLNLPG